MLSNPENLSTRGYTIYAIIGTVVEVCLLIVAVAWFLPLMDVNISWWGALVMLVALLGYSFFTYVMGVRALQRKADLSLDSIVGAEGVAAGPLRPSGYVKIRGEMWKATATAEIERGRPVLVTGIRGMKLTVEEKKDDQSGGEKPRM